ncbi:MAG TPA: type VII secretion-associated serine protease, partial [Micromonosporaceae bacterium]|nr:type VII secretion-associated serine protease [Micromonosporaceae bacterium]
DKIRNDQWQVSFLELAKAHQLSQGEGITVAVVDSGIDPDHPDLTGNVLKGFDVVTGGSGDGWGDVDGHGTGMAGLVAAHGHGAGNGDGALGLAPKAKILPVRIDTGSGIGQGDAMAIAIDEAVKRGAKIISISITTDNRAYDPIQRAIKAGVIVVSSVGNRPKDHFIGDPGAYPGVLAVGATGKDGNIANESVRGKAVALVAPGVDIVSSSKDGKYRIGTGTSPSTAIVAGAAASVWSKYPQLTSTQVIDHLTKTAVDKGTPGRDDEYGFGALDLVKALNTAPGSANASTTPTGPAATDGPSTPEDKSSNTGLYVGIGAAVLVAIIVIVMVSRRRRSPSA